MDIAVGYLGADVSKGCSDFILMDGNKKVLERNFQLDDNLSGHKALLSHLKALKKRHGFDSFVVGMESTGGYERNWLAGLKNAPVALNLKVFRLNPFAVKSHRDAMGRRNVTDAVSAEAIASYLISHPENIRETGEAKENHESARLVYTNIKLLSKQCTQLLNQFEKLLYACFPEVLQLCKRSVPRWLLEVLSKYPTARHLRSARIDTLAKIASIGEKKAGALKAKASKTVASKTDDCIGGLVGTMAAEILHRKAQVKAQKAVLESIAASKEMDLLCTIKGVGKYSAAALMIEIEEVSRFRSAKELASFFGVHPVYKVSGDGKAGFRMSKRGRSGPRAILYNCAFSAVGFDPHLRDIYKAQREKGMKHKPAIGVIMHKILRIIYGILKSGKPYDPQIDKHNREKDDRQSKVKDQTAVVQDARRYQNLGLEAPLSGRSIRKRKEHLSPKRDATEQALDGTLKDGKNTDGGQKIACDSSV